MIAPLTAFLFGVGASLLGYGLGMRQWAAEPKFQQRGALLCVIAVAITLTGIISLVGVWHISDVCR